MKKGFTLIELLAVILILGIIALIAIPTVNNIIKEAKYGAFKSGNDNIMKTIEQECQTSLLRGETPILSYLFTNGKPSNKIDVKGQLPEDGYIHLNKNCSVVNYYLSNNNNIYSNKEDAREDYMLKAPSEEISIFQTEYPSYYNKIINVYFIKNLNIPEEALFIKDISVSENGKIKSWLIENGEYYDLYVGSENIIYGNADSQYLFYQMESAKIISLENFNTSFITNMSYMFMEDAVLEEIDVSNWDTSNVKRFASIFRGCMKLKNINVSNWYMKNAQSMSRMFYDCYELENIDISRWITTDKLSSIERMFYACKKIVRLDVSTLNTTNVGSLNRMFTNCVSLIEITGLDKWNTSKVTKMNMIFQGCKQLKRLDLSNWDTKSLIDITEDENSSTRNGSIFTSCIALEFIDITGWDTSKIKRFVNAFAGCMSLKQIKGLDTWNFGNAKELVHLFYNCPLLEELDLSNVNFSQIENLEGFINECGSLNKIVLNNNTDVNIVSNYLPNRSLTTTGSITLKSDKTNIDTTLLSSKNWNLI